MDKPILVIEDDEDLATVVAQALEVAGYRSTIALNGRKGLIALEKERPPLILLDLMMPVMDGWQFRKEQIQIPEAADIPVIVMTADGRAEEKASKLDATGFLAKPVSFDALITEVKRVLAERDPTQSSSSSR